VESLLQGRQESVAVAEEIQVGRALLQLLYVNHGQLVSKGEMCLALGAPEKLVEPALGGLVDRGLLRVAEDGYGLTEEGFQAVHQRNTSYCPHL